MLSALLLLCSLGSLLTGVPSGRTSDELVFGLLRTIFPTPTVEDDIVAVVLEFDVLIVMDEVESLLGEATTLLLSPGITCAGTVGRSHVVVLS